MKTMKETLKINIIDNIEMAFRLGPDLTNPERDLIGDVAMIHMMCHKGVGDTFDGFMTAIEAKVKEEISKNGAINQKSTSDSLN